MLPYSPLDGLVPNLHRFVPENLPIAPPTRFAPIVQRVRRIEIEKDLLPQGEAQSTGFGGNIDTAKNLWFGPPSITLATFTG